MQHVFIEKCRKTQFFTCFYLEKIQIKTQKPHLQTFNLTKTNKVLLRRLKASNGNKKK